MTTFCNKLYIALFAIIFLCGCPISKRYDSLIIAEDIVNGKQLFIHYIGYHLLRLKMDTDKIDKDKAISLLFDQAVRESKVCGDGGYSVERKSVYQNSDIMIHGTCEPR